MEQIHDPHEILNRQLLVRPDNDGEAGLFPVKLLQATLQIFGGEDLFVELEHVTTVNRDGLNLDVIPTLKLF